MRVEVLHVPRHTMVVRFLMLNLQTIRDPPNTMLHS